jgi:hypothetical protein
LKGNATLELGRIMVNVIPGVSSYTIRNHVLRLHRIEAVGSSFETGRVFSTPRVFFLSVT